jgi:Cu/Ag efflux pump CusA
VVFLAAVFMILGIGLIRNMPIDVFPEFAPPRVEVQTPSLGLSSAEVESLVTIPLEQALAGTPGLDVMRSKSVNQLSSILLIFDQGTDIMQARQLVQERMSIATPQLPRWASPPVMLPPLSSTARTLKIGLTSDEYNLRELSMITYWKIRERLLRVPGVANVAIWGEQIDMLTVQVDPELMAAHNVSMDEVLQVTSDTLDVGLIQYSEGSEVGAGGFLETPNQRMPIFQILPVVTAEDLANVPINDRTKIDGSPLRLGDVADTIMDTWPMIGDAVVNDRDGLLLIIEKFPWANTVQVTHGLEAAMEEMRPGLPGVTFDTTIFRPATFVEVAMSNLVESLLIGGVLVVLVLLIFLWDWRIALISATIIPLTMVITLLVLNAFDTTLNVMVLAGLVIAIGAVVDDAIVDVENIVRRMRQARREGSDKPTATIVLDASVEVREAIVTASLTIRERISPIIPPLHRSYVAVLSRSLMRPIFAYSTTVVLLVLGVIIYPLLGSELLPSFKERDFLMHWLAKPGTGRDEMFRISRVACEELMTIPGVRNCGSHIGQALLMDEVYGIYFGENWVSVDPSVDYDETLNEIQTLVDGYPGLYRDVQTYLKERIREVLTGSSDPIVIRIFGPDLEVLRDKAAEVQERLDQIEGLEDVHTELLVDIPQIQVEVDLDKAQQYGLKPGDVRRAAAYMIAGEEVGDIHVASRTYDVNVWSTAETRANYTNILELPIDTPSGKKVQLKEVADISIQPVPNSINHEGTLRRIDVEAKLEGRDLGSAVADVEQAMTEIDFPLEYHAELLGEFAESQAASQRLMYAAIGAILVIFFLLRVSLGSFRLAFMSFLSLPLALVGGILAAYFTSGVLSLGSLVGFLTILGVAARNGIMLISHYQHLEEFEGETFGLNLVIRGAKERISPIMMTALTAGLALVPIVWAGIIPGHEIEHPMAIVILGGLVTSTLVNLFIVPSLYLVFGRQNGSDTPPAEAQPA